MVNSICSAAGGIKCSYKRNVKPFVACVFHEACPYQEAVSAVSVGQQIYDKITELEMK